MSYIKSPIFNRIFTDKGTKLVQISADVDVAITTDHSIRGSVGHSFVISTNQIGRGAYGQVYTVNDEFNKKYAVKCCNLNKNGIPTILELSIMASMVHPYLNRALSIHATDNKLYIIQDLAISDLLIYSRNNRANFDQLRDWFYCIAKAVSALHSQNIIHCDIKPSNILLFDGGVVKLSDFSLALVRYTKEETYTHTTCTCPYRPLECLMRTPWDELLDIWSLGCSFYEITYGKHLFVAQEPHDKELRATVEGRINSAKRLANAIIVWAKRKGKSYEVNDLELELFEIDFVEASPCEQFSEDGLINDLILRMLVVNAEFRPSINDVLAHPLFKNKPSVKYDVVNRASLDLSKTEIIEVSDLIKEYNLYVDTTKVKNKEFVTDNEVMRELALSLYSRCNDLKVERELLILGCVWIASKIVLERRLLINKLSYSLEEILLVEREICHNLCFRLHCI